MSDRLVFAESEGMLLFHRLVNKSAHSKIYSCTMSSGKPMHVPLCLKASPSCSVIATHVERVLGRLDRVTDCFSLKDASNEVLWGNGPLVKVWKHGLMRLNRKFAAGEGLHYCVVMPFLDGATVETLLLRAKSTPGSHRSFPLSQGLKLASCIARNIDDLGSIAGTSRLIHQDIKPSNIMVSPNLKYGTKLIDFDTAFFFGDDLNAVPCGTYGYVAPERMLSRDWAVANGEMDIYSLGVVAHELLTGMWPYPIPYHVCFQKEEWQAFFARGGRPCISESIPKDIVQLVDACLEINPANRPTSATAREEFEKLAFAYQDSALFWSDGPSVSYCTPTPWAAGLG